MNNIETMRLALEALETNNKAWKSLADSGDAGWWEAEEQPFYEVSVKAITALRQAIEQAQQAEPDYYGLTKDHLWMSITKDHYDRLKPEFRMACYTSPPPRQPLTMWTEAQHERAYQNSSELHEDVKSLAAFKRVAKKIAAMYGIKGNT